MMMMEKFVVDECHNIVMVPMVVECCFGYDHTLKKKNVLIVEYKINQRVKEKEKAPKEERTKLTNLLLYCSR